MENILTDEVEYHAHSFTDPVGRLFWWKGGLYRSVSREWAPFYAPLLADGFVAGLVEKGLLIDTELADMGVDDTGLVLRHRAVPFVSYPFEWCPAMFRDAVLAVLDLMLALESRGLSLRDGHPWNVLFEGTRPVFVDFSSITRDATPAWNAYNDFCQFCLYPLILMARGQDRIARLALADGMRITLRDVLTLGAVSGQGALLRVLSRKLAHRYAVWFHANAKPSLLPSSCAPRNFLLALRRDVLAISLPRACVSTVEGNKQPSSGQTALEALLGESRPASLVVVGCEDSWPAVFAAQHGIPVIAMDKDASRVGALYAEAKTAELSILPLVMDIRKPTPDLGPARHWAIAATERLRADTVLALGSLVHRLACDLYFPQIVEGLAAFTGRWLVVEFVPASDAAVRGKWWSPRLSWYTLDAFIAALGKHFASVEALPSDVPGRTLLLCGKAQL